MIACLSLLDVSKHYSSDSRGVRLPFALECYFYQRFSFLISLASTQSCICGNLPPSFAGMSAALFQWGRIHCIAMLEKSLHI